MRARARKETQATKYTTLSFEAEATPYITDINGDGLWDIVVVSGAVGTPHPTTNVWLNT